MRIDPYTHITIGCASFLAAVLWFDLMFDVQVIPYIGQETLPADVLASIRGYYLRVTTEASPMGNLVGMVMILGIVTNLVRLFRSPERLYKRALSVILMTLPTSWALLSIVPDAVFLASGEQDAVTASKLALRIFMAHVVCLVMILALIGTQLLPDGGSQGVKEP